MKLSHISKVYHNKRNTVEALKDINLEFNENGLIFLLGSSGCGKTTLLNIISGKDKDYDGECNDVPVMEYLTQHFDLFESLSVLDNLLLVKNDLELIESYLKEFNLVEHKDKKVKKCSNGQKKRIQFIRSLLNHPGLLLCDEPTAALDHDNTELLMKHLQEIGKDVQIIIVTHDIALAEKYGDRIIRMSKRSIVSDEIRNKNMTSCYGEKIEEKKFNDIWKLVKCEVKSRIPENLFVCSLLLASILVVFTTFNLYTTVQNRTDYMDTIKHSRSLVLSLPNDMSTIKGQEEYGSKHFDMFQYQDLLLILEHNSDILAVEAYYDDYLRPDSLIESMYIFDVSSIVFKEFNLPSSMKIEEGAMYGNYNIPSNQTFLLSSRDVVGMDDFEYQYRNNSNGVKTYYNCDNKDYCFDLERIQEDYKLALFDLINSEDLPIIAGRLPKQNNEVLLARDTADMLIALEDNYNIYEELIGKEIIIGAKGRKNSFDHSVFYMDENMSVTEQIPVVITGISSVENEFMNMVFFNSGFAQNAVMTHFVENYDNLWFEYVRFILRPGSDIEAFINEANSVIPLDKSSFSLFEGEGLGRKLIYYQSPESFMIYCSAILLIILLTMIMINLFIRKRMIKESAIMIRYGYNAPIERILRIGSLLFISFVLALLIIQPFSNFINDYAHSLYYDKFMDFNLLWLLLATLAIGFVYILCEGFIGGKHHD